MTAHLYPADLILCPTIDVTVPIDASTSARLVLDGEAISWGATRVDWESMTGVGYASRTENTGLRQRRVRRVTITSTAGTLEVVLGRTGVGAAGAQVQSEAYYAIVDRLHRHVEPRLRVDALDRIHAGQRFDVHHVSVTRHGLLILNRLRRRSLTTWDQLPAAHFELADVVLTAAQARRSGILGTVSMLSTNAVLLPEICIEGIHRYG